MTTRLNRSVLRDTRRYLWAAKNSNEKENNIIYRTPPFRTPSKYRRGKRGCTATVGPFRKYTCIEECIVSTNRRSRRSRRFPHLSHRYTYTCVYVHAHTPHSHRTAADDPTHGALGTHNAPHLHPITPDLYLLLACPLIYRVSWRDARVEQEKR